MPPTEIELDERLQRLFDRARAVPPIDPQASAGERAKFLAQGEILRAAVSQPGSRRHNQWINNLGNIFRRKEHRPMLSTLMAIMISMALVFGGAGATVFAAQDSLPEELLYPVKTWSEEARLALTGTSRAQLALTLEYTNRRMAELTSLESSGKPIPAGVATRMQNQLEAALQIAAGMEDPELVPALEQIRQQSQIQLQAMAALMNDSPELDRLRERLQEQTRLAEAGLSDPQGFRLHVRDRDRLNFPSQTPRFTQQPGVTHTPAGTPQPTGNSYGPGPGSGQTSQAPGQYGPGEPNPSQPPAPGGEGNGPGPGNGQPSEAPGQFGPGEPGPNQTPAPTADSFSPGPGSGQPSATPGASGPGPGAGDAPGTPGGSAGPGNGSTPSQTPQPGDPGPGSQNPTQAPPSGGPGQGGRP